MPFWGRFWGRAFAPKFYLIPYEATNSEKKFWPKNVTSNPPNDMNLQYISLLWTKFWNEIEFEVLPPGGQDFQGPFFAVWDCFETAINHSLLVVEFKTKSYFKIWSIVMEYIVRSGHLEGWKYHFWAKTFFTELVASYVTK